MKTSSGFEPTPFSSPFLFRFAVDRTAAPELGGYYSKSQSVWVKDTPTGPKPMIDDTDDLVELATKTAAFHESDDDKTVALLELVTKTDAKPEVDDHSAGVSLLELSTKTHAQMEGDDTTPSRPAFFDGRPVLYLLVTNRRDLTCDYIVREMSRVRSDAAHQNSRHCADRSRVHLRA